MSLFLISLKRNIITIRLWLNRYMKAGFSDLTNYPPPGRPIQKTPLIEKHLQEMLTKSPQDYGNQESRCRQQSAVYYVFTSRAKKDKQIDNKYKLNTETEGSGLRTDVLYLNEDQAKIAIDLGVEMLRDPLKFSSQKNNITY